MSDAQITEAQLDESHAVYATGTSHRPKGVDFYVLRLHPKTKRRLRIGKYATIVFKHPLAEHQQLPDFFAPGEPGPRPSDVSGCLVAHCLVDTLSNAECKAVTAKVGQPDAICAEVDQTLRNALGIPWRHGAAHPIKLHVYPLKSKNVVVRFFEKLLGVRYLYFRVCRSLVADIEKDFVRIPKDCFSILGLPAGASIVVERPINEKLDRHGKLRSFKIVTRSIRAFAASDQILHDRRKREVAEPGRYFPSERYLYRHDFFDPSATRGTWDEGGDVPLIFADAHFRAFGVEGPHQAPLSAVGVVAGRRSVVDVLVREFQDFGLALVIAMLPLVQAMLPTDTPTIAPAGITALFLLPAGVLTMLCWRVRNQVR